MPEHEGRILICRRAIEPRLGYWTVPAGFMENGETLQDGAARECQEEALAQVNIGSLLVVANVLSARQVHVFFRAVLAEPTFGVGPESLETKLVDPGALPWPDIAFPSTEFALQTLPGGPRSGRRAPPLRDPRASPITAADGLIPGPFHAAGGRVAQSVPMPPEDPA